MIWYLIITVVFALAIIGAVLFTKSHKDIGQSICIVAAIVVGFMWMVSTVGVVNNNLINQNGKFAGTLAEREALVYQLENGTYNGSSNSIGEFNHEVAECQNALCDIWINWFYPAYYKNVDLIELQN